MLFGVALFAAMDAMLQELSGTYAPMQLTALRAGASLPLVLTWALATMSLRDLVRVRWRLHLLRGALGVVMMSTFIYGLNELPLSTVYAVFFVAPLLVTGMSVIVLREHVPRTRWVAIIVGLLGVLIVLQPSGESFSAAACMAVFASAVAYSAGAVMVPLIAKHDSPQSMMFWLMLFMTFGAGTLAAPGWIPVRPADLGLIATVALVGVAAQFAVTEAFRTGDASFVAPFEYSALIWGALVDYHLHSVVPAASTWLGASVIVTSALVITARR